jgi:D-alanyl-D-alanine carboxypeptidase/D-alanyl-D-alanine-endopeptidase (penicillin-binding protein 4)
VFRPPGGNLLFVGGQVRIGAVASTNLITVHEPAALFIALLRESLERAGVSLRGRVRTIGWRERLEEPLPWNRWMELAFVESPPLQELVRETMKRSQNLYAALLLQCVGVHLTSTNSFESAEVRGARALSAFLEQVGLNRRDYFFNEGSGLSRENLVTANGVVSLLIFMSRHAAAEIFTSALPVAGVDGTLERRMNGTSAAKNVRAKTGALRWANALSGYVTTAAGERLAFALLLNRHQEGESNGSAQQELDGIAVWLAGLRQHSRNWKP